MNHTTFNKTISSCGSSIYSVNLTNLSPGVRAVLLVRIVVNTFTCPLTIALNILVMVAVKTKRQLRTKSNIALACLSTTDLVVGLVLQPLYIAKESLLLRVGIPFCTETDASNTEVTFVCFLASFHHLVLMTAERYVAIKHPLVYETQVTEVRIIMGSALAWASAIILSYVGLLYGGVVIFSETLLTILPIYFNVSVYKEVRRNEKQIAANQVSLEAKEKLLKKRKAFYTTTIVVLVILLCYIPSSICSVILISFKERISLNIMIPALFATSLLPVLNSLFNPLIYAFRIRYFRAAFIQLLARKIGPRQIGVNCDADTGQGNPTLSDEHEPTRQTEPHGG